VQVKGNLVVSFSGGKDSTAMLLMLLEKGYKIHSVVTFETGWEHPEVLRHMELVEKRTGIEIVRLKPPKPFEWYMYKKPVVARAGPLKGKVYRYGYGWPTARNRWCTRLKVKALWRYVEAIPGAIDCQGMAADERRRTYGVMLEEYHPVHIWFPLCEWGITEADALEYCFKKGYHWDGLYKHLSRVGCYCCPFRSKRELKIIRRWCPNEWKKMLKMDNHPACTASKFHKDKTLRDIERDFRRARRRKRPKQGV